MKTKFLATKKIKIQVKLNHRIRPCLSIFLNLEQYCFSIVMGLWIKFEILIIYVDHVEHVIFHLLQVSWQQGLSCYLPSYSFKYRVSMDSLVPKCL